ncbi:MAG: leucine-rich repeat protein [Treponema sp.]|nr:leucine-rich repeat protein [Treponema sp.]
MKNKIFNLGVLAVLLTFAFMLTGCEDLTNPLTGKTPLDTPANVRVDDAGKTAFILKWDAVEGADSYTLDIDGELKSVSGSTTSYDLRALTADPKVYPIRVRAVAYNGDEEHSDSAYSDPLNVEPAEYIFTYEDESAVSPSVQFGRSIARAAGGGGTITGLTNYGKGLERIVIPPRIGSITVTAIGDEAFKDNSVMTAISLPETLSTIGAGALSGTNIASLVIPESVLNIGDGAFSNIIVLVVVVFVSPEPPALGNGVFTGSEAIETIVVPDGSGSAYTEMIEEKAPELSEQAAVEEAKEEKLLIGIEVVQPPKTAYAAGEQFSIEGMTVIARYSDNTALSITNYTVLLQNSNGGFSAQSRALTVNDTAVRLSYTEGTITRTTDITISVTGQTPSNYAITVNQSNGGTITTNPSGSATAGTNVYITVTPNSGYQMSGLSVTRADNGSAVDLQTSQSSTGLSYYFIMPASAVTVSGTFSTSGGGSSGGTFTLNNIPSEYNGKYALLGTFGRDSGGSSDKDPTDGSPGGSSSNGDDITLVGAASINMEAQTAVLPRIANGSVSIPMWIMSESGTIARYSGNNTVNIFVGIFNTATPTFEENSEDENSEDENSESEGSIYFDLVTFTNGNATKSWNDGEFEEDGREPQPAGYTITVNQSTGGTITTNPSGGADAGTTVTVNVSLNQGYTLASLSVTRADNGNAVNYNANNRTFTMPASNVTVTGTFTGGTQPSSYAITVNQSTGGTVTTNPSGSATAGSTVTVTATPNTGYTLAVLNVTRADDDNAVTITYNPSAPGSVGTSGSFTMPASAVTVSGIFAHTGGSGGTFTLNNIPSEYNGKYALLGTYAYSSSDGGSSGEGSSGGSSSGGDDVDLIGVASITGQTITLPQIANGSVSIPMWIMSEGGSIARYSGNNTADIYVGIYNNATVDENSESEGAIYFELVVFSNGNATKSWNDGEFQEGGDDGPVEGGGPGDPPGPGTGTGR